jgi:hypothetical protein
VTIQLDILRAVRGWLKAAVSPALTDKQVIPADDKGTRPALPYMTVKLTTLHQRMGEDERGVEIVDEGLPGERVDLTVTGARRGVLQLRGYGAAPGEWLAEAELALSDPQVLMDLGALGVAVRSLGGIIDVAQLLDTKIEARWSQDYEITYMLRSRREAPAVEQLGVEGVLYRADPDDAAALTLDITITEEP